MTAPGQYASARYVVAGPAGNLIEPSRPARRPASPAEAS
jgi:hypothetical protein